MKKKVLSVLLIGIMVIMSFTACKGNKTAENEETVSEPTSTATSETGSDSTSETTVPNEFSTSPEQAEAYSAYAETLKEKYEGETLNVVSVSDPWVESMMEVATEFEDLTGATINFSTLGYDAAYSKETLIGSQSSDEADLFVYDIPWIGALGDYLLPIDDFINKNAAMMDYEDFFSAAREASAWNDQVLGVPFAPYYIMLTYNTKMFKEAGVEVPTDFDELKSAAAVLTTDSVAGIALNNQSGTCVGQAYFEYIYNMGGKPFESVYPGSEDYYADMTPLINSKESLEVVKFFKDMLQYEGDGALNMAWNERFSSFASGKAAIMIPWITDITPLDDPEQSLITDSYATAPTVMAEGIEQHTPIGGYSLGVSKFSKNQDLAKDFLAWFTTPQTSYKFATTGGLPARYSLINDEALAAEYPYYMTMQQIVDTAFVAFRPQIPESFEIMDTVGSYIGKYLDGSMELGDAMNTANSEVTKILEAAGYNVKE
ncbi:MAG: extracellular solute-binding protein [Anaerocolumna sp.]